MSDPAPRHPPPTAAQSDTIEAIMIHPPVVVRFQCSEHPLGAEDHVLGFQINPESTLPGVRGSGRSSATLFQQLVDGEPTDVHVAYVRSTPLQDDLAHLPKLRSACRMQ